MKPNFFINCTSIEDVKQLYKKLAMLHHPDKGGDTLTMQQINAEYQQILKDKSFSFDNEEQEKDFIIYPEVISKLIVLDQVLIELIGSWIWVSGNTYKHRETLEKAGLFFAPKKVMWYYRPSEEKCLNTKPKDIDEIRKKYGSEKIDGHSPRNFSLTAGCASLSGMLPVARGDQAPGFSTKDAWYGGNVVYKYHFCKAAKMYNQSFRVGFQRRNGSD
jgi:curved DNA-binding protein CbpA